MCPNAPLRMTRRIRLYSPIENYISEHFSQPYFQLVFLYAKESYCLQQDVKYGGDKDAEKRTVTLVEMDRERRYEAKQQKHA